MNEDEFIPYARQSIDESDIAAVAEVLKSDLITRGPKVVEYEEAIAAKCKAEFAVAFNSGTSALFAACRALNLSSYDRVVTTPNSFVATLSAPMMCGAPTTFVDIDRDSGNMCLEKLAEALPELATSRGKKVVMPVHFSGIPVDVAAIDALIKDPYTRVIEDGAHALGSKDPQGNPVGSCTYSDMTIFSTHPLKNITTGEGGLVTTNDPDLAERLRTIRNSGIIRKKSPGYYEIEEISGNSNFTEFQAALGISQLKRLDAFAKKRRELVEVYRKELQNFPHIRLFTDTFHESTAYHLFVVQIDFAAYGTTRESVMKTLEKMGIGTQVNYIPLYRHPFYRNQFGNLNEHFPNMEAYYSQALSLPLHCELNEKTVLRIVKNLKDILS